ncbi:hypothetical protein BD413DRAFT_552995 [Trametes elegans]|nr:hypothetical protein BD413DRAFT_552995 [Trametes elegans]
MPCLAFLLSVCACHGHSHGHRLPPCTSLQQSQACLVQSCLMQDQTTPRRMPSLYTPSLQIHVLRRLNHPSSRHTRLSAHPTPAALQASPERSRR